ncbi:hypothetical protein HON36_04650 [Candidatus Parcubacteria bacterium]|jgi:hypothetical protein|nr:hypothetical protein [Candidatus Parcubacteria bacterium]MBT7228682.1 hypothetical protein [Candidatus Parcubacteria bacterium]
MYNPDNSLSKSSPSPDSTERTIGSFEEEMKKIKTPEELLSFMNERLQYGFVGKEDGKIYSPKLEGWGEGESPEPALRSPEETLESGYGDCWGQTELERHWFMTNGEEYEFKTFLLRIGAGSDIDQKNPAHTMLVYKKDDKWYWFENTLDSHCGIHEFEDLDTLLEDVKNKFISEFTPTEDDLQTFKLYEYGETRPHECDNPGEFLSRVANEGKLYG